MIRNIFRRKSVTRGIDIYCDGQTHTVSLEPQVTKQNTKDITVVRYGTINFPDEPILHDPMYYGNFAQLREALSEDIGRILFKRLPIKSGKVLVRGVLSGDLEKTLEHGTDRWERERRELNYVSTGGGDQRRYTFARPAEASDMDSFTYALKLEPVHTAVELRFSRDNPYLFYLHLSSYPPESREEPSWWVEALDGAAKTEKGRPMILIFDGKNATPTNPNKEGYFPYVFEGNPRLLVACYFDVYYPRSLGRIDRELLKTGIRELHPWAMPYSERRERVSSLDEYIRQI